MSSIKVYLIRTAGVLLHVCSWELMGFAFYDSGVIPLHKVSIFIMFGLMSSVSMWYLKFGRYFGGISHYMISYNKV